MENEINPKLCKVTLNYLLDDLYSRLQNIQWQKADNEVVQIAKINEVQDFILIIQRLILDFESSFNNGLTRPTEE